MSNCDWDELEPGSTSLFLDTNMICIYVCLSDRRRDISISVLCFFAFLFLSELMTHFVLVKVKCKLETMRRHNNRRLWERKSQLCPYSGHSGSLTIRVLVFRTVSLISSVIEQGIRGFSRPLKALDKNLAKWLEWWDDGGCTAEEYLLNESVIHGYELTLKSPRLFMFYGLQYLHVCSLLPLTLESVELWEALRYDAHGGENVCSMSSSNDFEEKPTFTA